MHDDVVAQRLSGDWAKGAMEAGNVKGSWVRVNDRRGSFGVLIGVKWTMVEWMRLG
jgi:hypothetical protein